MNINSKLYKKGNNFKLYLSDNIEIIPFLNYQNTVIITSPPYNLNKNYNNYNDNKRYNDYLNFLYERFKLLYQYIEDDTRVIIVLKDNYSDFKFINFDFYNIMINKIGYKMYNYFIVESSHISKYTAWGSFCKATAPRVRCNHEIIHVYIKKEFKRNNNNKSTISKNEFKEYTLSLWKDNNMFFNKDINKKEHPAQFSPLEITNNINNLI